MPKERRDNLGKWDVHIFPAGSEESVWKTVYEYKTLPEDDTMIRQLLVSISATAILWLSSQCIGGDARAAELEIGRAATVITPNEQTGGVKPVSDDLHAKVLVLQQGDTTAAIVALDLPVVNRDVAMAIRKLAAERTRPSTHVAVQAEVKH